MHKLILGIFSLIKNIIQFCKLTCSFLLIMTMFAWLEDIIQAHWNWLDFIRPILDNVLDFANSIYSLSFVAFGTVFDLKYINAIVLFLIVIVISNLLMEMLANLEDFYDDTHRLYKKEKEKVFNKKLISEVEKKEKRILKYTVYINTKVSKKFSHKEININLEEQNEKMNDFIEKRTNNKHMTFNDGFIYYFDNFNNIDNILEVLFKVLKADTPLDYAICIQVGDDLSQLKKLADLKMYGKIITCADTVLRYKFNASHMFGTKNTGIFQKEDGTIEVHEFNEIL